MTSKYVYVGPDRPFGLPLMRNAVLAGGPETIFPALSPLFAEHKVFRHLFAPVAELARARLALSTPGSPLSLYSAQIKKAGDALKTVNGK